MRSLLHRQYLHLNVSDKQQIWMNFVFVISRFIIRTSLKGFPARSVISSNTYALDSLYLLVFITGTSQSRQHVGTSLIHIENCKSPTAVLFDDDTGRISIRHCEY
ncbi:hypothetical protein Tco_1200404 [Tanacetum coccineum]